MLLLQEFCQLLKQFSKVREKARSRKTRGDSRILEKISGFPFCTENRAIGLFWSAIPSNMH